MAQRPSIRGRLYALFALLAGLPLIASTDLQAGAPLRGTGDFEFYLDVASIPAAGQSFIQLLQIAVPTKDLRYVEKDGSYVADLKYALTFASGDRTVLTKSFQMRDTRDSMPRGADLSAFVYVIDSLSLDPGSYSLTVKVEDLQHRKKTLLGLVHRSYASSTLKDGLVDIREYPSSGLVLGDPILVWSFEAGNEYIPNPMRIYGLRKDTLTVIVRAAVPETAGIDSLPVRLSFSRDTGEIMGEELFAVSVRSGQSAFAKSVDLASYPAGGYRLTVEANAGAGLRASTGKDFNVAWELLNWQRPVRDILIEARILLPDEEYRTFEAMSIGEQERFMQGFWKELDPTPQTALNETYEKFVSRLRYADAHFSVYRRGALTDRGFIYIRLGPPDDIIRRPVPRDRDDLYEGIDKIMTDYKIIVDSDWMPSRVEDTRPPISSPEKQRAIRGFVGDDTGSFEIWSYNFRGDPILAGDRRMTYDQGLRFLFLDRDGYGEYRMTGTSEEMMEGD